jgi:bla regulator protein blaR1
MKNIIEILPSNITEALGWTLVHSIWQSILLLTIYQVGSILSKKSSLKYNLGLGLIGMQVVASFATYLVIYEPVIAISSASNIINYTQITNAAITQQIQSTPVLFQLIDWFNDRLPIIVNIWILGLGFYLIRFGYNFWQVNQLKTKHLYEPSDKIVEIFSKIKAKLESPKAVQLMESARVYSPVLIGYLKPIILLPIGLCSQLSVQEIEAILAHELAHSKRNDYLVNLIQSIVDIVYFFNPALIILSNQVRDQRENCCDEFASEICGDSMPIARALVSLESFRQESNLAMAFGRKGSSLKNRVHHILGISPEKANQNKGVFFVIGMIIFAIFYVNIENTNAQEQQTPKKPKPKNTVNYKDGRQYEQYSEDGHRKILITDKNGTRLNIHQENGSVFMNGKEYKLPKADSAKLAYHNAEIDKLEQEMNKYSSKVTDLSSQISKYSVQISEHSQPISVKSQEISKLSQQITVLANKQSKISLQIAKLDEEKDAKLIAELSKNEKKYESEIDKLHEKIDKVSEEIDEIASKIDVKSGPIDSLSNLIEIEAAPMEKIGEKIEEHSNKIWELYPEEVKAEYKKLMYDSNFNHYPKAPRPPKPPKAVTTPRPPHPPQAPKAQRGVSAPLAPVAPISPDTPFPPKAPNGPKSVQIFDKTNNNVDAKQTSLVPQTWHKVYSYYGIWPDAK